MAKSTGMGGGLFVDEFILSNDIQDVAVSGGPAPLVVTGIDKSAVERKGGLRDGQISGTAFFNDGTALGAATFDVTGGASEDLWTLASHGLAVGDKVKFSAVGTGAEPYAVDTFYYVVAAPDGNTFQLSATSGGGVLEGTGTDSSGTWTIQLCNTAHPTLSSLPTANTIGTYAKATSAIGDVACSVIAKQANYDGTRAADGMLTFSFDLLSAEQGVIWGKLGTAGVIDVTGTGNQTRIAHGSATTGGLRAVLHVTEFTGTNATIEVQESSDNGSGDAYAAVASFTSVTGVGAEAIAVTGDVEQDLRVSVSAGTFSTMSFVVNVCRIGLT